ncbi:MAG: hypothetical protein KJ737_08300 [Proteobacteria bacterium]|nr:hypothetical protein [Pseudomonadota bacterium]
MTYKILSNKDVKIFEALGSGIIPGGGQHFEMGARDLSEKWLPRTDYLLSRMNLLSRTGMRFLGKLINIFWPMVYLRQFSQMIHLPEDELVILFHRAESSGTLSSALILLLKVLICPPFYGLKEVKESIDYKEKFPNPKNFEGIKA